MINEKLKKEIIELYEKLERDKDLYKEFLEDEDKFLEARGFIPSEVKGMVHSIVDSRKNILNRSHIDWLRVEQNWDLGNSGEHRDDLDLCVHF